MPVARRYGHIFDPAGHRYGRSHALVGVSKPPTSASLESFLPSVKDQGRRGRCVGFATSESVFTSGKGSIFLPSPTDIYRLARAIDRARRGDGSLPPLIDEGSMPNQAIRAMAEFGVRPYRQTVDGADYDGPNISEDELNREPAEDEVQDEGVTHIISPYAIDENADDFEQQFKLGIASGYAVGYAIQADQPFELYSGGVLGAQQGRSLGGHDVMAYGYEVTPDGEIYIDNQNSWGIGWGISGRFRGNRAFMGRMQDVIMFKVRRVGAA